MQRYADLCLLSDILCACDRFVSIAQLTINEVTKKGVAQLKKGQRSTGIRWLKVCGRDEYLDP